jgi:hypothetical protein
MADVKISALTELTTMTDAAVIPVVEGGATKKITGDNLQTYFIDTPAVSTQNTTTAGAGYGGFGSGAPVLSLTNDYVKQIIKITNSTGAVAAVDLPDASLDGKSVIVYTDSDDSTLVYYKRNDGTYATYQIGKSGQNVVAHFIWLGTNWVYFQGT